MAKKSISLRVDPEKIKKIDEIAYTQKRSRSFIVQEAIESYVAEQEFSAWQMARIKDSIGQADRKEFVPKEEMDAFLRIGGINANRVDVQCAGGFERNIFIY